MSRVCVAITGDTAAEMITRADAVIRENAFLEFRLDYLEKPLAAMPKLREFLYERSEVTAVATCRRIVGGGRFKGAAASQLEILTAAAAAGFHLIDVEIETAEAISKAQMAALRAALAEKGTGLILSSHDFDATRDLDKTFARLQPFHPEFIKIVSTARSLADNLEMLHFLQRKSENANLIGICMGDQGLVSRVLGVRSGSIFTFGSATEGEETGPGQIAARTLIETYRINQVENSTRVFGVAGNPIRHSLSPLMQNTAFRRETVNAVFLALEARKLSDLLKLVRELPLHGLSVTMPFKQEIMPYLEKTDALSEKIGACNTVVRSQDGRLFGFNTDVGGITRPIERRMQIRGAKVLILGAGGAGRAAAFGLVDKGAEVHILNRTPETAQKLARQAKARTIRRDQVAKTHFDIILNATPAGMTGQKVSSILEPHELNARIVFDTVYNPVDTPLIRMAREKGIAVISGVEMFVQQGARQFEIWTGKPAPEEEMMRVVLHALRRRAEAEEPSGKRGEKGSAPSLRLVPAAVETPSALKLVASSVPGAKPAPAPLRAVVPARVSSVVKPVKSPGAKKPGTPTLVTRTKQSAPAARVPAKSANGHVSAATTANAKGLKSLPPKTKPLATKTANGKARNGKAKNGKAANGKVTNGGPAGKGRIAVSPRTVRRGKPGTALAGRKTAPAKTLQRGKR